MSADIEIAGHNKATVRQADFLGNPHNIQGLTKAASESLQAAGIDVKQAVSDSRHPNCVHSSPSCSRGSASGGYWHGH